MNGHIVHYDGLTKREVSFGDGDPEIGVSLTSAFGTYANYGARFLVEKQAVITEVQTALTQRYGKTNHTYLIRFFSDDNGLPGVQIGDDYIFDAEKIPEWPKWRSYEISVYRGWNCRPGHTLRSYTIPISTGRARNREYRSYARTTTQPLLMYVMENLIRPGKRFSTICI